MTGRPLSSDMLIDLLVARLVRDHGRTKHHWRKVIGAVRLHSTTTHSHCNWTITPTGGLQDVSAVETLLDELRLNHPILPR